MKHLSFMIFSLLVTQSLMAQNLPDEINYPPYQKRFEELNLQVMQTEDELSGSNKHLSQTRDNINEDEAMISRLELEIRNLENSIFSDRLRIDDLQKNLTQKKGQLQNLESQAQNQKSKVEQINRQYLDQQKSIRPLEERVARQNTQIREAQGELNQLKREEGQIEIQITQLKSKLSSLDQEIARSKQEQAELTQNQQEAQGKLNNLNSTLSHQESQYSEKNSQLLEKQEQLAKIEEKIKEFEKDLNILRRNNASADQIAQAEKKLAQGKNKREELSENVGNLRSLISNLSSKIADTKSSINQVKRSIDTFPSRLAEEQRKEREDIAEKGKISQNLKPKENELAQTRSQILKAEQKLSILQNGIRQDEGELSRLNAALVLIERELDNAKLNLSRTLNDISLTKDQVVGLSDTIRDVTAGIPRMQNSIDYNRRQIGGIKKDLFVLRETEKNLMIDIRSLEIRYVEIRPRMDKAKIDFDRRKALFLDYLYAAQNLGESQIQDASMLGKKDGEKMAKKLSLSIGTSMGKELGSTEARHWASVRAEVAGFDEGYLQGENSLPDQVQGNEEGRIAGVKAARDYVTLNLEPQFFEEFYLKELSRDVLSETFQEKGFEGKKSTSHTLTKSYTAEIPPLSDTELRSSFELKTSLDDTIARLGKEVKTLTEKSHILGNPSEIYEPTELIPFGKSDCSKVYQGLEVYLKACREAYEEAFEHNFSMESGKEFKMLYPSLYESILYSTQKAEREVLFQKPYSEFFAISKREGLSLGKADAYHTAYKISYEQSYALELPVATNAAYSKAGPKAREWVSTHPAVTVTHMELTKKNLRGEDQTNLLLKLKNVSPLESSTPIVLKILSSTNLVLGQTEMVIKKVPGMKEITVKDFMLSVNPNARSGDKVKLKAQVSLPGDVYQNQRLEVLTLETTLMSNPKFEIKTEYLKYPDIRGVFRTKNHFFSTELIPMVEDIPEGYEVRLTPKGENAGLIYINEKVLKTPALKKGQVSKLDFSYSFPKVASGKTIELELSILYGDEVIRQSHFQIQPN